MFSLWVVFQSENSHYIYHCLTVTHIYSLSDCSSSTLKVFGVYTERNIYTPDSPVCLFIYFPSSECPSKGKYSRDLMPHFKHTFRYLTFHIWTSTRIKKSSSVGFNNIWQPSMSPYWWPTVGTVGRGLQRLRYTITPEPAQLRSARCSWKLQKAPKSS